MDPLGTPSAIGCGARIAAVALAAAVFAFVTPAAAEEKIAMDSSLPDGAVMAGMATVDLTPDLGRFHVSLNGYGDRRKKPARGALDPIMARALVITDREGRSVALVGTDLCYVNTPLRDLVIDRLAADGFTQDNVLIAATHTHAAFSGYDRSFVARLAMGSFDEELRDLTVERIANAVREAQASARPARVSYAMREVENLNRSRLDPGFEHGLGKSTNPVDPLRYPTNRRLSVLRVTALDGTEIGAIVHFTAHPTVLSPKNMAFSADFPSVVYREMENAMGPTAVAIYWNGSLGDTAPMPDWEDTVTEEVRNMEEYGLRVAEKAREVYGAARPLAIDGIRASSVRRAFRDVTIRPIFRWKAPEFISKAFYTTPELAFQAIALGPIRILTVPGEPTTKIGWHIETLCPQETTCLVVAPANGYMGYLTTPSEYETDAYESDSTFFGPTVGDRVKEALAAAIDGL